MTDAQKLAIILSIIRAAVANGDARARVLADAEEVARLDRRLDGGTP